MSKRLTSWVLSANGKDQEFPLNNLPYGVFSIQERKRHCGVAIGDQILDVTCAECFFDLPEGIFAGGAWNAFMELGEEKWSAFRERLMAILSAGAAEQKELERHLVFQKNASMHLPFRVAEFTDFYAGRHHATHVGTIFRGAQNALPPNWLHLPIGYNGRASSVVVSGTEVVRPLGQIKAADAPLPRFAPSERFDFELEIGAIVGQPSTHQISVEQADKNIFGYVLLNDWSARDIQAWEYQPLGPFQAKATATTISPWIVTREALEPFRVDTPAREFELLDYLKDKGPMLYDIDLTVSITPRDGAKTVVTRTNYKEMYYSSAQQLAHHTSSGCPMRVGDLLGSGTISGAERKNCGSMLEMSWGGKEPIRLMDGTLRTFLEDGDRVTFKGVAHGEDYQVGFGLCEGRVIGSE